MNDRQRARIRRAVTGWALGSLSAFAVTWMMGVLVGVATPGGWPAWQIGALVVAIAGGIAMIIFAIIAIAYVFE